MAEGRGHIDGAGRARMVDVSAKEPTARRAVARALVEMEDATLEAVERGLVRKGDVLGVAQTAGIMAAKATPSLIPMCHPLPLDAVGISFDSRREGGKGLLGITAEVACTWRTGVEMEAMVAAATAALTVYDMLKGIDRWMVIREVALQEKRGGKSGRLVRGEG